MANKLFLVSATLAFFFLLTNASIYRTIVEVDEDGATNQASPFQIPRCQREFQQAQHLRSCQQWLQQQARQSGGGRGWVLDGEFDFEDNMVNYHGQGQQQRPHQLQQCCNELQQVETQCVCPSLKVASKAVKQQIQQQGGQRGQQGQQQQAVSRIYQVARNLPNVCNIPQVSACPFQQSMPGPYY